MKYISLLRGINVSGQKKILMADLKDLYLRIGMKNPVTYIQSGNVIFDSRRSARSCVSAIQKAIEAAYKFVVPVQVLTVDDWSLAVQGNPFLAANSAIPIERLYIAFLDEIPEAEYVAHLEAADFGDDKWHLEGKRIYLCYATKCSNSKLTNNLIEKKLKVSATTRNWKTTLKLHDLTSG